MHEPKEKKKETQAPPKILARKGTYELDMIRVVVEVVTRTDRNSGSSRTARRSRIVVGNRDAGVVAKRSKKP